MANVRTGMAPPLAEGFVTRPETAPGLAAVLAPGAVVALVPGRSPAAAGSLPRDEPCGTTQLAVHAAESAWRSREVDLLAWVSATSRASVLAGYLEAALGIYPRDGVPGGVDHRRHLRDVALEKLRGAVGDNLRRAVGHQPDAAREGEHQCRRQYSSQQTAPRQPGDRC